MIVLARRGAAWRRATIAGAIIVLHLAVAVVLLRARALGRPTSVAVAMTVRAVPAVAPRPVVRHAAVEAVLDPGLAPPAIEIAAPEDRAPSPCDVPGSLGPALQADPAALAVLAAATTGPERAIMAWNGGWAERPDIPPLRHTVGVVLRATRTACLDEPVTGPRLVFVPVGGTTVTVAFGSGLWSWRSLLSNDRD